MWADHILRPAVQLLDPPVLRCSPVQIVGGRIVDAVGGASLGGLLGTHRLSGDAGSRLLEDGGAVLGEACRASILYPFRILRKQTAG